MNHLVAGVIATCLLASNIVAAYDVLTHENLTHIAVTQSSIEERVRAIGLTSLDEPLDGLDPNNCEPLPSSLSNGRITSRSIRNWIKYGARREDDNFQENVGNCVRVFRHFYNPLNGQGLGLGPVQWVSSPAWAIEDEVEDHNQEYSIKDANRYYYEALTASNQADRSRLFAQTFFALGHVMHHLQDMAQPQHVRNDPHSFINIPTLYERYTKGLAERGTLPLPLVNEYRVDIGNFPTARSFWGLAIDPEQQRGLALFSNRGFVSQGTNFGFHEGLVTAPTGFPRPEPVPSDLSDECDTVLFYECEKVELRDLPGMSPSASGIITFLPVNAYDANIDATESNKRATTFSVFSDFGDGPPGGVIRLQFSVNRFTFGSGYSHLLKRSVGYSAGILDYFFRGSVEVAMFGHFISNAKTLRVTNTSSLFLDGSFRVFYDDAEGNRHSVDHIDPPFATIFPGGSKDFFIAAFPPTAPPPGDEPNYLLVVQGAIGAEGGVVGRTITVTDPPPEPPGTIQVIQAYYGRSCVDDDEFGGYGGVTESVQSTCNGQVVCNVFVSNTVFGDPFYGCPKDFDVYYNCSNGGRTKTAGHPPVVNEGYTIELSCP